MSAMIWAKGRVVAGLGAWNRREERDKLRIETETADDDLVIVIDDDERTIEDERDNIV